MATASAIPVPAKKGRFWRIIKRIFQVLVALVVLAAMRRFVSGHCKLARWTAISARRALGCAGRCVPKCSSKHGLLGARQPDGDSGHRAWSSCRGLEVCAAGGGEICAGLFVRPRGIWLEHSWAAATDERRNHEGAARLARGFRREGAVCLSGALVWRIQRARVHEGIPG